MEEFLFLFLGGVRLASVWMDRMAMVTCEVVETCLWQNCEIAEMEFYIAPGSISMSIATCEGNESGPSRM